MGKSARNGVRVCGRWCCWCWREVYTCLVVGSIFVVRGTSPPERNATPNQHRDAPLSRGLQPCLQIPFGQVGESLIFEGVASLLFRTMGLHVKPPNESRKAKSCHTNPTDQPPPTIPNTDRLRHLLAEPPHPFPLCARPRSVEQLYFVPRDGPLLGIPWWVRLRL